MLASCSFAPPFVNPGPLPVLLPDPVALFSASVWRASSFPFRVDPARVSDGPSCRFFDWRYRLNALLTGPSLPPLGHGTVQESGRHSPIPGDLLQFRRRIVQEGTQGAAAGERRMPSGDTDTVRFKSDALSSLGGGLKMETA